MATQDGCAKGRRKQVSPKGWTVAKLSAVRCPRCRQRHFCRRPPAGTYLAQTGITSRTVMQGKPTSFRQLIRKPCDADSIGMDRPPDVKPRTQQQRLRHTQLKVPSALTPRCSCFAALLHLRRGTMLVGLYRSRHASTTLKHPVSGRRAIPSIGSQT